MNIEINKLSPTDIDDFIELVRIFEQVFEWGKNSTPKASHLQKVIDNPRFMAFVAKVDSQIVGGLTAHILDRYDSDKPSAYIYDIAVLNQYQRKGTGQQLITYLNDYCLENGFSEAYVQAETEDLHAVDFYRTTPISDELQATHFTYSFEKNNSSN